MSFIVVRLVPGVGRTLTAQSKRKLNSIKSNLRDLEVTNMLRKVGLLIISTKQDIVAKTST